MNSAVSVGIVPREHLTVAVYSLPVLMVNVSHHCGSVMGTTTVGICQMNGIAVSNQDTSAAYGTAADLQYEKVWMSVCASIWYFVMLLLRAHAFCKFLQEMLSFTLLSTPLEVIR